MIHFSWIWIFLLLPLPLIVRWLFPPCKVAREETLFVPFASQFAGLSGDAVKGKSTRAYHLWLATLVWVLLVVAAARPQWLGEPVELPTSGRDLLLAVDISGSMQAEDFVIKGQSVNRLIATKIIAGDFIERRTGDRLGLLLFGEHAYTQVPLTFDRKTVKTLLNEAAIGLAGEKKTAIGDVIGLAVKRLRDRPQENRVVILLTDGTNNAGVIEPLEAAELAKKSGVTIYTIGIGADSMVVPSIFGNRRVNPSEGLDEESLEQIAQTSGGRYFRARDTKELEQIYGVIDTLEPVEGDNQFFRPKKSLFYWPLAGAFVLSCLMFVLWRER